MKPFGIRLEVSVKFEFQDPLPPHPCVARAVGRHGCGCRSHVSMSPGRGSDSPGPLVMGGRISIGEGCHWIRRESMGGGAAESNLAWSTSLRSSVVATLPERQETGAA